VLDFSTLPPEQKLPAIHRYASEQGLIPFQLELDAPRRFALLHAGPQEDYLYIGVHHINFDAWSHYLFTGQLMLLYASIRRGEQPELSSLPIQYLDYVVGFDDWLQGETRAAFIEHWKRILSGDLPTLELPTDRPRQPIQTDHGARYYFTLSSSLSARLKEFGKSERLTPFHLLMTAYAVLLMRYTCQEDILLGCPFANRPRLEQNKLIGMFVNTLPIRLNLAGNPMVRDLIKQVRAVMLDAFTWQALPFETLVSELAPQRDLSRTPIFQVAINMVNVPRQLITVTGLELSEERREETPAQFDLMFEFAEEGGLFKGSVIFNTDLFYKSTVIRMAAHFQNILTEMLAQPDSLLSELEMLAPAERITPPQNIRMRNASSNYSKSRWNGLPTPRQ
jgi:aspartate racemase